MRIHQRTRSVSIASLGLAVAVGTAAPAMGAQALFDGTTTKTGFPYAGVFNQTGATATLQGGTGPAGFKIPSWGTQGFSFTFSGGIYVNFNVYRSEEVFAGDFTKSFHPLAPASTTLMHNEAVYPAVAASPAPGRMNIKYGVNGFGGVQKHHFYTKYVGTVANPPGFSNVYLVLGPIDHNPASLAEGPNATGGGQRTNQTTFQVNGTVWDWDPQLNHMTGTLTGKALLGGPSTVTFIAVDGRNAAGTTGTIQMVAPSMAYSYFLGGSAWDGSGTNPVSSLTTESDNSQITTLTFLPEPAQFLALGAGVFGLLGLNLLHRRRH